MNSRSAVVTVAICAAGLLIQVVVLADESRNEQNPQPEASETRELGSHAFTNSIGMKFVHIPQGEFVMGGDEATSEIAKAFPGDTSNYQNEHPKHRVRIAKPFHIGAYEVTVGQFRVFVESEGYATDAEVDGVGTWGFNAEARQFQGRTPNYSWKNVGWKQTDDHPVVNVSWNDAVAFCKWLSRKEQRTYALPTEAQWEYACRAGTRTRYFIGNDPESLPTVANVADASFRTSTVYRWGITGDDGFPFTAPVGSFKPNGFGVYDTIGNVSEWCADRYDEKYYEDSPAVDPMGPQEGSLRVIRGGSLRNPPVQCRCALRYLGSPNSRRVNGGFRVVLTSNDDPSSLGDYGRAVIERYPHADANGDGVLTMEEGVALLSDSKQQDGQQHLKTFAPTETQLEHAVEIGRAQKQTSPLSFPKGHGFRVVMTGHSGVYPARSTLSRIAIAAGFNDHRQRSHMSGSERGSANAIWLWELGQFYGLPPKPIMLPAIATGDWDVMTWGAYYDDRPQHYSQWIDFCLKANPRMKFFIQEIPPQVRRTKSLLIANDIVKQVAAEHAERRRDIYVPLYETLDKEYPGKIQIIPTSTCIVEMVRLYAAGELPDLDCIDEDRGRRGRRGVYVDGTHLSSSLEHLVGYVYFGILYGQNPELIEKYLPHDVPVRLDRTMRQVAWQAVQESYARTDGPE